MRLFHAIFFLSAPASAFHVGYSQCTQLRTTTHVPGMLSTTCLEAKKSKNKKKKKNTSSSAGLKGFGSTTKSSSTSTITVPIDRSKAAMDFYSYLEANGAGANLKRVALGFFPFNSDDTEMNLRGVVALKKIPKGEIIIEIPYEAAWNLGRESSDPTLPGTVVLQEYCQWISGSKKSSAKKRDLSPYLEVLPPFGSDDVLGSTDFFSDEALDMLQMPQIKEETLARRKKSMARFERDVAPMVDISLGMFRWKDDVDITEEHLRWASWLVTSRVLTVQGEAGSGASYRLMIPLIDMCNHDRSSPHILTGRAVPGGTLKIVAGKTVEAGEQINIVYGGGVSGNDRFIQDYGFLDNFCNGEADNITGKILIGKGRIMEGAGATNGRPTLMPKDERDRALAALDATTYEEDVGLLETSGKDMKNDVRTALEFRIGVKKALKGLGHGLVMDMP
jgi:hypothetical protein